MKETERTVKIYPIYHAFTADLVFFIPIDTLFLSYVKGLSASQITFMNMFGLIICILFRKVVIKIAKEINNLNSVRLGMILLFISTMILTFSKTFYGLLLYSLISNLSAMLTSMLHVLIKHDLSAINKTEEFVKTINLGNITYGIVTLFTTIVAGYLYNYNNYLPLYITLVIIASMFLLTFAFVDKNNDEENKEVKQNKFNKSSKLVLILLSSSLFVSIFRIGQNNSKLFLQYDLQNILSLNKVTLYITYIVFVSRIVRILSNLFFTKLYHKYKLQIGNYMAILHFVCYGLLIVGHCINNFYLKILLMSLGYFIILGIRDPFQTYIEDITLKNTQDKYQQQIVIELETYRKIGQLIINLTFTLILLEHELVITEIILMLLAFIEIIINYKMTRTLEQQ